MVHNFAEETDPFVEILNGLQAPMGKFAVLGNHDYGAYFNWKSSEEEAANLERVKAQIRACGFDLLLNERRTLSLNGDHLDIIGHYRDDEDSERHFDWLTTRSDFRTADFDDVWRRVVAFMVDAEAAHKGHRTHAS